MSQQGAVPPAKLTIGWHGLPELPAAGPPRLNALRGGPEVLLAWLESQLGLTGPAVAWSDRVVAYVARLQQVGAGPWRRSFETDVWGTAGHVLRRRDEALLEGWSSTSGAPLPGGLAHLAALEPSGVPPGVPERLQAVINALDAGFRLPPHEVLLAEPVDVWPRLWQDVLAGLVTLPLPPPAPCGDGALGVAQGLVLAADIATVGVPDEDQSVRVVRASTPGTAVSWLTRWLRRHDDVAVVCQDGALAARLDAALAMDGQPTMGVARSQQAQPAKQVLPLALGLLRTPVNPWLLLDLLVLPVGPLRRFGFRLARALEEQPGFESPAWQAAKAKVLEDDDADGTLARRLRRWLEHERFPPGADLPSEALAERCGLVAQWATSVADRERLAAAPDEELLASYTAAASQAATLGRLVEQWGSHIAEAQLERLLQEVQAESRAEVAHPAKAGGPTYAPDLQRSPAADTLVWLAPCAPAPEATLATPGEHAELTSRRLGRSLELVTRALRQREAEGLARARRLLVIEVADDSEQATHPLWLHLQAILDLPHPPVLEQAIAAGDLDVAGDGMQRVTRASLPGRRIAWDAPDGVPAPPSTSATALEDQLACPLRWTLRHALKIRPSSITSIPEGVRLKGIFAHQLFEAVFEPGAPPTPDAAAAAATAAFDRLLPSHAAPLAVARKLAERQRLQRDLAAAAREFATVLQNGDYHIVGLEVPIEQPLRGVVLKGAIDCVVANDAGEAIIDFKFGNMAHRKRLLRGSRALQLATYAKARQDAGETVAAGAYFILENGALLTPEGSPLDGVRTTQPGGDGLLATWTHFDRALDAAADWLTAGPVMARPLQHPDERAAGSDKVLDPDAKADEVPGVCRFCDYKPLCGREVMA